MPRKRAGSRSKPLKHAGLPLASTDTPRAAQARKRERRADREDPEYLAWIRTQPCCVHHEHRGPVHAHHEPPKSHAGDWSDFQSLPMCERAHVERHAVLGLRLFEEKYGICLLAKALELRGRYLQENA